MKYHMWVTVGVLTTTFFLCLLEDTWLPGSGVVTMTEGVASAAEAEAAALAADAPLPPLPPPPPPPTSPFALPVPPLPIPRPRPRPPLSYRQKYSFPHN